MRNLLVVGFVTLLFALLIVLGTSFLGLFIAREGMVTP